MQRCIHETYPGVKIEYRRITSSTTVLRLECRALLPNGEPHDNEWWPVDDEHLLAMQQTDAGYLLVAELSKPTAEMVADLKLQWASDPVWEIEDTPGFESVRAELLIYRRDLEAKREAEAQTERLAYAAKVGANLQLADYIRRLEERIAKLEARVNG